MTLQNTTEYADLSSPVNPVIDRFQELYDRHMEYLRYVTHFYECLPSDFENLRESYNYQMRLFLKENPEASQKEYIDNMRSVFGGYAED